MTITCELLEPIMWNIVWKQIVKHIYKLCMTYLLHFDNMKLCSSEKYFIVKCVRVVICTSRNYAEKQKILQ